MCMVDSLDGSGIGGMSIGWFGVGNSNMILLLLCCVVPLWFVLVMWRDRKSVV